LRSAPGARVDCRGGGGGAPGYLDLVSYGTDDLRAYCLVRTEGLDDSSEARVRAPPTLTVRRDDDGGAGPIAVDLDLNGATRWVVGIDRACVKRVAIVPVAGSGGFGGGGGERGGGGVARKLIKLHPAFARLFSFLHRLGGGGGGGRSRPPPDDDRVWRVVAAAASGQGTDALLGRYAFHGSGGANAPSRYAVWIEPTRYGGQARHHTGPHTTAFAS